MDKHDQTQVGKMVELKATELLHQIALRCLENCLSIEVRMAGKGTYTTQKIMFF